MKLILAFSIWLFCMGSFAFAENALTIKVHSKGMFLKAHKKDKRQSPARISLTKLGIKPGQKIMLTAMGDYKSGDRFEDNSTGMIGVFVGLSRKRFLHPAAGSRVSPATTKTCWEGNISSNDIPQDFVVGSGVLIVPKGAKAILFSAFDCYFIDNTDPDKNFSVKAVSVN